MSKQTNMQTIRGEKYDVKLVKKKDADRLVKEYHYSGKVVPNSQVHLGVFNKEGVMVGCLQYGPPMNGDKTSNKISPVAEMLELNRMVMAYDEPRNSESQAISLCNKWLRHNTDVRYILSFSDGKEENCGYIYQATNWKYLGYLVSNSFYDLDGRILHSVTVWHQYKEKHIHRETHTTNEILCLHFNNVSRISCKQHVYVMPLYKNVKFNFDAKPYPKKDKEVAILSRIYIKKDGKVLEEKEEVTYTDEVLSSIF